jgi:hypothetical protein
MYRLVEARSITKLTACTCQEHQAITAQIGARLIHESLRKQSCRASMVAALPKLISVEVESAKSKD